MKIIHARAEGARAEQRSETFTGSVWGDPLLPPTDGVMINTVHFAPCSRTYWHRHENGQILQVTSGEGWVATRDGGARRIRKGDTVWTAPGEDHWHGSDDDSFLVHIAITLGTTEWLEEVRPDEYDAIVHAARGRE
ncbi:MAG TPA: cupin domain-containing protein [Jiangellaceae bacterium]